MKKSCVVIPIETTSRELNSKIFLACKLAESNITVFLGTKTFAQKISNYINNVVYIDKGYHQNISDKIYSELKKNKCSIILLDEENGVDLEDFKMLDYRIPDQIIKIFDMIFLWGKKQDEYLKQNRKNYNINKFYITGHPRFDLLTEEFRIFYNKKINKIKNKYSNFILFASDNKFANNINSRKSVIKNYLNRYNDLNFWINYSEKLHKKNYELIKKICKKTNYNVIIRPHPEEKKSTYTELYKDFKDRVHVVYDDSSIFWILSAEFIIINHSTTGVESSMLGKPTISFTPFRLERNSFPYLPIKCSENFSDPSLLIKRLLNKKVRTKQNHKIFEEFFNYNKNSIQSIEKINLLLTKNYKFHFSFKKKFKFLIFLLISKYYNLKIFLKKITGNLIIDKLTENKLSEMNSKHVTKKFNEISKLMKLKRNIKLKKINEHLYCFKS